jgi:hypothetical protein
VCLSTYAHIIAELRGAPKVSAEDAIRAARDAVKRSRDPACGPNATQPAAVDQVSLDDNEGVAGSSPAVGFAV